MTSATIKQRLAAGERVIGTMVFEFWTLGIARIVAGTGAEFVLFDQEHSGKGPGALRAVLAGARASGVATLVRVPTGAPHEIASALDADALGVMVPMVESAQQARSIVDAAKHPPLGRRGLGALYADQYVDGDIAATIERANREQLVIAQVETATGLANVEEIAAVDGVDLLWLGQSDLAISIGTSGESGHPDFVAAVERIRQAAGANGKALGVTVEDTKEAIAALGSGIRCVALSDIALFEGALKDTTAAVLAWLRDSNDRPREGSRS